MRIGDAANHQGLDHRLGDLAGGGPVDDEIGPGAAADVIGRDEERDGRERLQRRRLLQIALDHLARRVEIGDALDHQWLGLGGVVDAQRHRKIDTKFALAHGDAGIGRHVEPAGYPQFLFGHRRERIGKALLETDLGLRSCRFY